MERDDLSITVILGRVAEGEPGAWDQALARVYPHLREMAHRFMRDQSGGHTLQTTALVHEAYLKLAGGAGGWENRRHFERVAARAMRQVLVDHARGRDTLKRGGAGQRRVQLTDDLAEAPELGCDVLALHEALERLQELDPGAAQVAELRCFGGLQHYDVARVIEVSERTVERRWRFARSWLRKELDIGAAD
jgi:RNA polymerase sigma factor (TIGR02999 family)